MSQPSASDRRFLDRRRMRTHVGLYVLPVALGIVMAAWVGLFAWWPAVINPRIAWSYYEGQEIPQGTVTTLHLTVTILVNVLLLVLAVALLFAVLWARSERRYLRLVKQLESPPVETGTLAKNASSSQAYPS